jgi:hypothetical protein
MHVSSQQQPMLIGSSRCRGRYAPMTATWEPAVSSPCSPMRQAAATGSVKHASRSVSSSGTRCRLAVGSVMYSAMAPSLPMMPSTVLRYQDTLDATARSVVPAGNRLVAHLPGAWLRWKIALLQVKPATLQLMSPVTRFPTHSGFALHSRTTPTNSWPRA